MSAEPAALSRCWRVGTRTCTLTVPRAKPGAVMAACAEWSPTVPTRLSDAELAQYRKGRDAALAEMCAALGIRAAVVEL